jgi:hypothetical protein
MSDMGLHAAGERALLDRFIGYYKPYGESHAELDHDEALFAEVRNAAATLREAVHRARRGEYAAGAELHPPRQK